MLKTTAAFAIGLLAIASSAFAQDTDLDVARDDARDDAMQKAEDLAYVELYAPRCKNVTVTDFARTQFAQEERRRFAKQWHGWIDTETRRLKKNELTNKSFSLQHNCSTIVAGYGPKGQYARNLVVEGPHEPWVMGPPVKHAR